MSTIDLFALYHHAGDLYNESNPRSTLAYQNGSFFRGDIS